MITAEMDYPLHHMLGVSEKDKIRILDLAETATAITVRAAVERHQEQIYFIKTSRRPGTAQPDQPGD
ncbi:MAG: hypothetical protein U5K99_10390 [Anaerolineales bacterium]|nr:hypothetical protein [Anaerolineales bacterium]